MYSSRIEWKRKNFFLTEREAPLEPSDEDFLEGPEEVFSLLWQLSYLSTVSDTAAIGPVFDSRQLPVLYNDGHWAHVSPYTSSFDFAETCGFNNQSPATIFCDSTD